MSDTNGVTIPLPEIENFEDRVVEACARHLLYSTVIGDGEQEGGYTIQTELQRKVRDEMLEVVREQAREAAPDVVRAMLEEGVPRTDRYGDPLFGRSGEMMSLRSVIAETIRQEVRHSSGRSGEGVISLIIREEVQKSLRGEMVSELNAAKIVVLEALREESAKVMELALSNAMGRIA